MVDDVEDRMDYNDSCRFCRKNLRISGVLGNCCQIFETQKGTQSIAERLSQLGVEVTRRATKSSRICKVCRNVVSRLERDLPLYWRWVQEEKEEPTGEPQTGPPASGHDRDRQLPPSDTPGPFKQLSHKPARKARPVVPRSILRVISEREEHKDEHMLVKHIVNKKWKAAARLIMKHEELSREVKASILTVIERESRTHCDPNKKCMLWGTSPEDLSSFSFRTLESDLQRLSPLLFSIFSTITKHSRFVTCAAAAIALRGREDRLSGFAYYINSVLQYVGPKRAVFDVLSKFAISTSYVCSVGKKKGLANKFRFGLESLQKLKEEFWAMEAGCPPVSQEPDKVSIDPRGDSMSLHAEVQSTEDLQSSGSQADPNLLNTELSGSQALKRSYTQHAGTVLPAKRSCITHSSPSGSHLLDVTSLQKVAEDQLKTPGEDINQSVASELGVEEEQGGAERVKSWESFIELDVTIDSEGEQSVEDDVDGEEEEDEMEEEDDLDWELDGEDDEIASSPHGGATFREHMKHICQTCNKEFKNGPTLTRHERTHTRDKPYRCKVAEDQLKTPGEDINQSVASELGVEEEQGGAERVKSWESFIELDVMINSEGEQSVEDDMDEEGEEDMDKEETGGGG